MAQAARRGVVAAHRVEDAPQVAPRRRVAIAAVQEPHVCHQARDPVGGPRVADDRPRAARSQKLPGEAPPFYAAWHVATGEVHQVLDTAVAGKRVAELLGLDTAEERAHRTRLA